MSKTYLSSQEGGAGGTYDPDHYWNATEASYPHYPTVRHRKRFILGQLKKKMKYGKASVFDFGCGEGTLLKTIQDTFVLSSDMLGGSDVSEYAVQLAKQKIPSPNFSHALYPALTKKFDVIICSEVIEHTTKYADILKWMGDNLNPGGWMIVTTQAGQIHASDTYTGHTQHFVLQELRAIIENLGLRVRVCKGWGWPFFTLQKYLTDFSFNSIREGFLEGTMSLRKRLVFQAAYAAYFLHDAICKGPQLYVVAEKK